ncbi:MAG: SRPBCC family protein [Neobacillus sp.]
MIEWKEEIKIDQNIEKVWDLFSDQNIKRIMPKVEDHTLIEKQEHEAGAKHRQTYREGKRLETYIVDTVAYEDLPDQKHKQISFVIGKAFQVSLGFTLIKLSDNQTKFIYEGENKGVNFIGRAMMKLANKKGNQDVVKEFLERVHREALK